MKNSEFHGNRRKLSPAQVKEIANLYYSTNLSQLKLAQRFGVSSATIYSILNRQVYQDVDIPDYRSKKLSYRRLTHAQAYEILDLYFNIGWSPKQIAAKYKVKRAHIYKITNGISYCHVYHQFHTDQRHRHNVI